MQSNNKSKVLVVVVLVMLFSSVHAQSFRNAFAIGSTFDDDAGTALVIDKSNNIIVTGTFTGTDADFNPAIGTKNLQHVGSKDVFVAKYDSEGVLQWAISFGGVLDDESRAIAVDGSGNIYVTGYVEGQVDFNPSSGEATHTPFGNKDIFLVKFSANGAYLWSRQLGGAGDEEGFGVAIDKSNFIYTVGYMTGTNVNFNPEGSPSYLDSYGQKDIFFTKCASSGSYQWAGNVGGSGNDEAHCIVIDKSNNLYIGGYFTGNNVDFNPAGGVNTIDSYGGDDAFVFKLTASGGYQWVVGVGGTLSDRCEAIALDSLNNFYIAGSFRSSNADFNPVGGTQKFASKGFDDIFIAKYSLSGATYQGAFTIGGSVTDLAHGICVDRANDIYVTGSFGSQNVDFDPDGGVARLSAAFTTDCYVAKYTEAGLFDWAYALGATTGSSGNAVAVNKNFDLVTTGAFSGVAQVDPALPTKTITSVDASDDIFVSIVTGITVGVDDDANRRSIAVYPNPCGDVLRLDSPHLGELNNIVIYDVVGRVRKQSQTADELWVGDLAPGTYHLSINSGAEKHLLHFIKR